MSVLHIFLLGMGCPKPIAEPAISLVKKTSDDELNPPIQLLSGKINEGVFRDHKHEIAIPISDDWVSEIGDSNAALRLRLQHQSNAVSIEYWIFDGQYQSPIPSERCSWSFTDNGYYSRFKLTEKTTVASCEYDDQSQLVFAIVLPIEEQTWQVEIHTEPAYLIQNLELAYSQIQGISLLNDN